ncbi:MAG: histidinol-phosphatase HisJ family protein [candidate division Zixibacteria bacterium]|nr:histidinol-phosphatase HisJ family protein [candidate division Zixibacteria bacterium]
MLDNLDPKFELYDCHVHPDYSLDASGSVEEYCQKALRLGLKGLCFTTHYDTGPERKDVDAFMRVRGRVTPLSGETLNVYLEDIEKAKFKFAPSGLKIWAGLEVDYTPLNQRKLIEDLSELKIDYQLGAIHCLENIAITSSEEAYQYFKKRSVKKLCEDYYTALIAGIRSGLFQAMAHLDGFKKYALDYYGEELLQAEKEWIIPVLKELKEKDIGIELNTGWFKKGRKRFFPDEGVLKSTKEFGIKIVATGSDAHRIEDLGLGLQEAVSFINENKLIFEPFYQ